MVNVIEMGLVLILGLAAAEAASAKNKSESFYKILMFSPCSFLAVVVFDLRVIVWLVILFGPIDRGVARFISLNFRYLQEQDLWQSASKPEVASRPSR
jgi:ABC-type enterochelin transport system permease subunit